MAFDDYQNFKSVNFRKRPELYRIGRGEQGVFLVEPYKSELLPLWKFKTPIAARASAKALLTAFHRYKAEQDLVGMDMARKFLQMGYTRARRYANHRSGKKYRGPVPLSMRGRSGAHGRSTLPLDVDLKKAKCAAIFKKAWSTVERIENYRILKAEWKLWYG